MNLQTFAKKKDTSNDLGLYRIKSIERSNDKILVIVNREGSSNPRVFTFSYLEFTTFCMIKEGANARILDYSPSPWMDSIRDSLLVLFVRGKLKQELFEAEYTIERKAVFEGIQGRKTKYAKIEHLIDKCKSLIAELELLR